MSTGSEHRQELNGERAYVAWAYAKLDQKIAEIQAMENHGATKGDAGGFGKWKHETLDTLSKAREALVFGRLDCDDDPEIGTFYVGKAHVDGLEESLIPAVVDWRAPIAERFYQATRTERMGVARRRTIRMDRRAVTGLADDVFVRSFESSWQPARVLTPPGGIREHTPAPPDELAASPLSAAGASWAPEPVQPELLLDEPVPGRGAVTAAAEAADLRAIDLLLDEMARTRSGAMHDVVATIQAEQDRLIRAPIDVPLVIQGGPGTGKTVVGLHRAAYVLYEQRHSRMSTSAVLVLGPNQSFVNYISSVLPALGEGHAHHGTVVDQARTGLPEAERVQVVIDAVDGDDVARIKGDLRMAAVIAEAVWSTAKPARVELALGRRTVRLTKEDVAGVLAGLRRSSDSYTAARAALPGALARLARERYASMSGTSGLSGVDLRDAEALARSQRLADKLLPDVTPRVVVTRLLTKADFLSAVAGKILRPTEQRALVEAATKKSRRLRFTAADVVLIGEASAVVGETALRYDHVVVDEAQDLSPMEWRLVLRRASRRSITILGDLAQATSVWGAASWSERLAEIGLDVTGHIAELRLGYRAPAEVIEFVTPLLRQIAPDLPVPTALRSTEPPIVRKTTSKRLPNQIASLVEETDPTHNIGVIGPPAALVDIEKGLRNDGVDVGLVGDALSARVTLVEPEAAKGLEFDTCIVAEPSTIAGRTHRGRRLLFIALTRATRRLCVVHSRDLPPVLRPEAGEDVSSDQVAAELEPPMTPIEPSAPETPLAASSADHGPGRVTEEPGAAAWMSAAEFMPVPEHEPSEGQQADVVVSPEPNVSAPALIEMLRAGRVRGLRTSTGPGEGADAGPRLRGDLQVLARDGRWVKVRDSKGRTGWVQHASPTSGS